MPSTMNTTGHHPPEACQSSNGPFVGDSVQQREQGCRRWLGAQPRPTMAHGQNQDSTDGRSSGLTLLPSTIGDGRQAADEDIGACRAV